jgi:hypothetical protein
LLIGLSPEVFLSVASASLHVLAAVDRNVGAGHERRFIGGQVDDLCANDAKVGMLRGVLAEYTGQTHLTAPHVEVEEARWCTPASIGLS